MKSLIRSYKESSLKSVMECEAGAEVSGEEEAEDAASESDKDSCFSSVDSRDRRMSSATLRSTKAVNLGQSRGNDKARTKSFCWWRYAGFDLRDRGKLGP